MAAQPLCRYCGKAIRKKTETIRFGCADGDAARFAHMRTERPRDKAEAQRYGNGQVVSVRYSETACITVPGGGSHKVTRVPRYVEEASYWDGESYVDWAFCNGDHARRFGYSAAGMTLENGSQIAMPEYWAALAKRDRS
jgi:hypothetical protein